MFIGMNACAEIAIIVHLQNTVKLNKTDISQLFLGQVSSFPNGAIAIPVALSRDNNSREIFNETVLNKTENQLQCKVMDGGKLGSKRHVNLPGIRINLPSITEKDKADIAFGLKEDVDFIALSFVRNASDVEDLKSILKSKSKKVKIISKIEDQEGLSNIDEITQCSDGVMVARGDLGIETDLSNLPNIQRKIRRG